MRFVDEGPVGLQVAVRGAVAVLVVYGALRFADRLFLGREPPAAVAHPVPPPGARDSLDPAVWVPGGTFTMGSDDPGLSTDPASPFSPFRPARPPMASTAWRGTSGSG